jgi:hypothetical protein
MRQVPQARESAAPSKDERAHFRPFLLVLAWRCGLARADLGLTGGHSIVSLSSTRLAVPLGLAAGALIVGIALGAVARGSWPFKGTAADADVTAISSGVPTSARKIALEWCADVPHRTQWAMTAAPRREPGQPVVIQMGSENPDDRSATAFVMFIAPQKFEDVWKHYAEKCRQCGYEGPEKESLAQGGLGAPGSPDDPARGGMLFGRAKDEIMLFDLRGVGAAKPGVDPSGPRESHFAYYTDGYVVHVVLEEIGQDRWASYKGLVKVRVFAVLRPQSA